MFTGILGTNNSILGFSFVLGAPTGPSTYDVSASSTIVFTSVAEGYTLADDVTQTIGFTSESDAGVDFAESVTDTIAFTSVAVADHSTPIDSLVEFTSEADADVIIAVRQTINFTSVAGIEEDSDQTDTLNFTSTVGVTGPWYRRAIDNISGDTVYVFDPDTFTLVETTTGLRVTASADVVKGLNVSHQINFTSVANGYVLSGPGLPVDAESEIVFSQRADDAEWGDDTQVVNFTSVASASIGPKVETHTIEFTSVADAKLSQAVEADSVITFTSTFTYTLIRAFTKYTYSPFIGDGGGAETPPAAYVAPVGTPGFRLQYPAEGAVDEEWISPRKPNFGNVQRLAMTRINRLTRGGDLDVFRDPVWPRIETLLFSISSLTRTKARDLLTFMDDYIGQEIRLIDHEDRLWRGTISQPSDPAVADGDKNCGSYTVSFEFEGVMV